MTDFVQIVSTQDAAFVARWFQESGGVYLWHSLNLSDPGKTWITPLDGKKPHWSASDPWEITDPGVIGVTTYTEVKRFHVALRRGSQGLSLKLTDASCERLRKAMAKAGDGAIYEFDYFTQEA
ncbi:hypothetical protein [Candidatus Magnetobacterium casense]|uniref:Uncharacterized protein n=1 Tax=Candidatus Magnetobacterium casense TaxID=1455061 RepID=A0ABS6S503_9BACT|nr:hypothetical protein [Candidatus Magnetobacterium casensis]MBV6343750.1 hypothetical protein [Candidatus Magnetobacterium casensis]